MRDTKENREIKWPREILLRASRAQDFTRPFFSTVFFRFTHDGLSERGNTRSLLLRGFLHYARYSVNYDDDDDDDDDDDYYYHANFDKQDKAQLLAKFSKNYIHRFHSHLEVLKR